MKRNSLVHRSLVAGLVLAAGTSVLCVAASAGDERRTIPAPVSAPALAAPALPPNPLADLPPLGAPPIGPVLADEGVANKADNKPAAQVQWQVPAGTFVEGTTLPSTGQTPGVVAPRSGLPEPHAGLPDGWQHHKPGQVVWSSEWNAPAPAAGIARAPLAAPAPAGPNNVVVGVAVEDEEVLPTTDLAAPEVAAPQGGGISAEAQADRRRFLVEAHLQNAREALRFADVAAARGHVEQALAIDPSSEAAQDLWRALQVDRRSTAGAYGGSQADAATVKREQAAIEVRNHLRRGQQLEASQRFEDAAKEYKKGLAIISWYDQTADFGTTAENVRDLIDGATERARVSARQDREEAIRRAQQEREAEMASAREQRLGRIRAWFEGAHVAFRRGEHALAREYARQILRADPTNCDAERIIAMSHDAQHIDNELAYRREFDDQWKSIMRALEESSLPQVDTVVFPENWLDDIGRRTSRSVGASLDLTADADVVAIRSVLEKKRVQGLVWEEANLDTAVEYLRTITGLNFHVTTKVREEKSSDISISLNLDDVSVATILDLVTEPYELVWAPRGGVVTIMMADEMRGAMVLRQFDVRDLAVRIQDFAANDMNLVPSNFTPPEPPDLGEPEPQYSADQLLELIKSTVGNEATWADAEPQQQNNILIIRNTPEVLAQVEDLLQQLRGATGVLVNLEVRFLTAEDNFLRDVGVDMRGLGTGVAPVTTNGQGPPVIMDDVFFGSAADPFGSPFGVNPEPSSVGTANDAGIFYDDGGDGAYSARVENLFDTRVRRFGNPEVLTNTGGLSFQHTYLDDTAVEVILRAVEKSERVQQITAPRLTVYNTQRANITVLNQISYVQDYEVEIAQLSNIANPVIQTIQEGVKLDVRPIVSSDRRFLTLELRPDVAELIRPIPEFTTNLASGPIGANAPVTLQIPELRVQRVRTTVTMPDGGTLLLGGMKYYEKDTRESGVPFLSKIPILSFLLTRKGNFVNRRNLLILVTARVVSLEEQEPRDDLRLPPIPERIWTPIREIDPTCGPCADGRCMVPEAPCAAPAAPCGCPPPPSRPRTTCKTCAVR